MALEAKLEQANQELQQAAQDTDKNGIVRLSMHAAEVQKQIEAQFAELEGVTTDHDQRAREFDLQLEQLDG